MKNLKRCSFSIIELVVAIVIIAIAMTSIPMLLNTIAKSTSITLKEKSFFNAFALLNLIQVVQWDENNTKSDNYYKVLTSKNGDSNLKCIRIGTTQLNNNSGAICANEYNQTSFIGIDNGEDKNDVSTYDDLDDFNGYITSINDINFTIKVRYLKDNANYDSDKILFNITDDKVDNSNIKYVELNVTKNNKLISILRFFSSNIGKTKIESRNE